MDLEAIVEDASLVALPVIEAALLGTLIAVHPLRFRRLMHNKRGREMLKAEVLICVAGALLVVVIGDSAARAFGLLGLGSFIRFRTAMKSPADTAIFFLLIGIGMACGVDRFGAAAFGTLFLLLILTVLEWMSPGPSAPTEDDDRAESGPT